jgi:protein-S-isoprenylcysteine O-methyltransferase Ste14
MAPWVKPGSCSHRCRSIAAAALKDFMTDLQSAVSSTEKSKVDTDYLVSQLTETGQLGKRGEALFVGQVVLMLLVLLPPVDLHVVTQLLGVGAISGGLAITVAGSKALGKNLAPLPVARASGGSLITDGMYKYGL